MRVFIIALFLLSCSGYDRYRVAQHPTRAGAKRIEDTLTGLGWDIDTSSAHTVATDWHRLRLASNAIYANEVQMRIVVDIETGTASGFCTQRRVRVDGRNSAWWFRKCTDRRALEIVKSSLRAVNKE